MCEDISRVQPNFKKRLLFGRYFAKGSVDWVPKGVTLAKLEKNQRPENLSFVPICLSMLTTNWSSLKVPSAVRVRLAREILPVEVNPAVPGREGMQNWPSLKPGHLDAGWLRMASATGSSPVDPGGNPLGKNRDWRLAAERFVGSTGTLPLSVVPVEIPDASRVP